MRIVLLSGGSGKRLWPLSNEVRSKAFLKLLSSEHGGKESMIQRVCRQLELAGLLPSTSIVTHNSQIEITKNHIGETIPIISEPFKRGTFTAVALAASYHHFKLNADLNETICILPVDLFVDSAFFQLLNQFPDILKRSGANLALVGTVPRHPSNQYGYIVPHINAETDYYTVKQFVEKPDEAQAIRLINDHALWNCGVFAFSVGFMLSNLQERGLPVRYEELLERYESLPEVSFDHEVVERTNPSVVIPYDGAWKDLGSWDTLTSHLDSSAIGSGDISADSVHTHMVNELPIPIHIIDVPNVIVAASPDGILVASKSKSSEIKHKLNRGLTRTMYEERSWGTCKVLDHSWTTPEKETETVTCKLELNEGKTMNAHKHLNRKEIWTVIRGSGEFSLNEHTFTIQAGDVLHIPCGVKHGVKASTQLIIIEVQIGRHLAGDVIDCVEAAD